MNLDQNKIIAVEKISKISNLYDELQNLLTRNEKTFEKLLKLEGEIKIIISEKSKGFPWVAEAISDYFELKDKENATYLVNKNRPAKVAAEKIRELSKEKKFFKKEFLISKYFIKYYESLFPWITEYVGDNFDDLIENIKNEKENDEEKDPVLRFVPESESKRLSSIERNQKALDRYKKSRKKPWQLGRDYERYIGYLYETKGYDVFYQGIEFGLEDLGRDLICSKENSVDIVQCKYWSIKKNHYIHEKHINQLYGTAIKYFIDSNKNINKKDQLSIFPDLIKKGKLKATFVTSSLLSDTAKKFAEALGIRVLENFPLKEYPVIKCNINSKNEKIYHLPFDQQYDKAKIKNVCEFYAMNVEEAEKKGFRRAWKWHGS
jgi:hypothetical protein